MIKKILKGCLTVLFVMVFLLLGYYIIFVQNSEINHNKTATPIENFTYITPSTEDDLVENEITCFDKVTSFNEVPDFKPLTVESANAIKLNGCIKESDRLNIVLFSHDGARADTIIFISFDPVSKKIDAINIPRDTYWRVKGYTSDYGNQKINAVYGRGKGLGGSSGVKEAIANLLQVPVHYVIKIDYDGAEAIINSIDGIEITIEHDMIYDDVWADPPLHIDIKEGFQVLDGHNAVDYLRWRKNNGEQGDGDLPRIRRMQKFADSVLNKVLSPKFPEFVGACFKYIYTDMELDLALSYALKATGVKPSDITFKRLPGDVKGYFYVMDIKRTQELLINTYDGEL